MTHASLRQCDERVPCCRQCSRLGLSCSGPIRGAVFLDMTSRILKRESGRRTKAAKCRAKSSTPTNIQESIGNPDDSSPIRSVSERPSPCPSTAKESSLTAVSPADESPAIPFLETPEYLEETLFLDPDSSDFTTQPDLDQALLNMANTQGQLLFHPWVDDICNNEYHLVGIFVDLITSSRRPQRSWVFELPNIMATTKSPSVKFSIRAAALIYYAVSNSDNATAADALHWYLAALESYRMSLHDSGHKRLWDAKALGNSPNTSPSSPSIDESVHCNMIYVPMMFAYFEQMQGATPDAGLKHLNIACDILQAIGPYACSFGIQHKMFRSVRSLEVRMHCRLFSTTSRSEDVSPTILTPHPRLSKLSSETSRQSLRLLTGSKYLLHKSPRHLGIASLMSPLYFSAKFTSLKLTSRLRIFVMEFALFKICQASKSWS